MTNSPTFAQIKAQVAAIRKKLPGTKSIAIRSKAKWSGKTSYEDNGEVFQIHQCDSPLAMRLALRESGDERTTVLVTDLDDHDISDDILVRLKPRQLIPLDSWQIVKALFQVRAVDPRVTRYGWMADVLMDLIPPNGYPPVATGFLDARILSGACSLFRHPTLSTLKVARPGGYGNVSNSITRGQKFKVWTTRLWAARERHT